MTDQPTVTLPERDVLALVQGVGFIAQVMRVFDGFKAMPIGIRDIERACETATAAYNAQACEQPDLPTDPLSREATELLLKFLRIGDQRVDHVQVMISHGWQELTSRGLVIIGQRWIETRWGDNTSQQGEQMMMAKLSARGNALALMLSNKALGHGP